MTDNLPTFVNMGPRFFDVRDGHYLGPAYDGVDSRRLEVPGRKRLERDHGSLIREILA